MLKYSVSAWMAFWTFIIKLVIKYQINRAYKIVKEELNISVKQIHFMKSGEYQENMIGYTHILDNGDIHVYFWIDELINQYFLEVGKTIFCDIGTLAYRLARHEFRHVWQFQYAWGATMKDGYKLYFLRVREADANKYGNGIDYAKTPEEYMDEVEYGIYF